MRVLLTGGMGFIGSHTAVSLLEAGHEPILYDNLQTLIEVSSIASAALQVTRRRSLKATFVMGRCSNKCFVTSILKLSFTLPALKR